MKTVLIGFLAIAAVLAQSPDRSKPPQTPPIPAFKLPPVRQSTLPNGLKLVLVEDPRWPLVTARLGFLAGSRFDPPDMPGLSENVAALLNEGTKSRSSRQIAEEATSIGGSVNGNSNADSMVLAGNALAENTERLLVLMADVARNANFPENEVALRKQNRKQALLQQMSDPSFLANQQFNATLYGATPYAHVAPTMQSLDRLDRAALTSFRDTYLVPNNAVLILLGRLPGDAEQIVSKQFGSWPKKDVPAPAAIHAPKPHREIVLVDRPGSVQADIHAGKLSVTRANPDYFPLVIASTVLGTGASSRMFGNIREKQGFAYDAHSELVPRKDSGSIAAVTQVRNDVLEPALKAVLAELDNMAKSPVSEAELIAAKNFRSGLFLLRLETQNALADQLVDLRILGLPDEYLERYVERLRAVEPRDVTEVARKYMSPDDASIVVVGDASKIGPVLDKSGKVTKVSANP